MSMIDPRLERAGYSGKARCLRSLVKFARRYRRSDVMCLAGHRRREIVAILPPPQAP